MYRPSRLFSTAIAAALVLAPLNGCGPALVPALKPVATTRGTPSPLVIATSEGGRGAVNLTMRTDAARYKTLAVVPGDPRDAIKRFEVKLVAFIDDDDDLQTPDVEQQVAMASYGEGGDFAALPAPNQPLRFEHLRGYTHYRVYGYAYGADGEDADGDLDLISEDSSSYLDFETDNDDNDVYVYEQQSLVLVVHMLDSLSTEFSGQGTTPGIAVTAGGYTPFGFVESFDLDRDDQGDPRTAGALNAPTGIAVVAGIRYVADTGNHRIVRIEPNGDTSVLVGQAGAAALEDGDAVSARFNNPEGLVASNVDPDDVEDTDDVVLWVADRENHAIRKILLDDGNVMVSTLAGNGAPGFEDGGAASARLNQPRGLQLTGNVLMVADSGNHCIRSVATNTGVVKLIAGQPSRAPGTTDHERGLQARFSTPVGLARLNDRLFVSDETDHVIREIDLSDPRYPVDTLAGMAHVAGADDGTPRDGVSFNSPCGLAIDGAHNLFIADRGNNLIRKLPLEGKSIFVSTLVGTGDAGAAFENIVARRNAPLANPYGLWFDPGIGRLFVIGSYFHDTEGVDDREIAVLHQIE